MRRVSIFAMAGALLLAFAATALARTYFFDGEGSDDKQVKVTFSAHGKPDSSRHPPFLLKDARLEDFAVTGATQTITCQGVPQRLPVGYEFSHPIAVSKDGDWAAKEKVAEAPTQTAQVKGQFVDAAFFTARFRLSGKAGGCSIDTGPILLEGAVRHPGPKASAAEIGN
jgi:hypothetical protein